MIDVFGADHGGYVKRMNAAVKALSNGRVPLDIKLIQLVKLFRNGEPFKMSKRAGTFVTLRDVVDQVGPDVTRFVMLTRKNDAPLDFDFDKVLEQSRENPVFYVQYANARVHSVLRKARDAGLAGLEFLSGIPGTIGGGLRMNAGAYGTEFKDILIDAEALDGQGNRHRLEPAGMGFGYRHCGVPEDWIFTSARLRGVAGLLGDD